MNSHERLNTLRATLWAITGAIVVMFTFFAILGGVSPKEGGAFFIAVAVLAILWLVHFLRRRSLEHDPRIRHDDRERRGF